MKPVAIVTAGPTHEPIDPVRFIGNRSSGKMGFAIAESLAKDGFDVKLICGPVSLATNHKDIERINVETAAEMYEASIQFLNDYQIAFCAAAVADFTPISVANQKIKKSSGQDLMRIELKKTKDILASLGEVKKNNQILVGFSLETNNAEENAMAKLTRKGADYIVMNTLEDQGAGFAHNTNKVTLYGKNRYKNPFPLMSKKELASKLISTILHRI